MVYDERRAPGRQVVGQSGGLTAGQLPGGPLAGSKTPWQLAWVLERLADEAPGVYIGLVREMAGSWKKAVAGGGVRALAGNVKAPALLAQTDASGSFESAPPERKRGSHWQVADSEKNTD